MNENEFFMRRKKHLENYLRINLVPGFVFLENLQQFQLGIVPTPRRLRLLTVVLRLNNLQISELMDVLLQVDSRLGYRLTKLLSRLPINIHFRPYLVADRQVVPAVFADTKI